jgi:putative transposase
VSPFIDQMRGRFGVAPICRVLGSSERSFYAAKTRPLCHRVLTDPEHLIQIRRIHGANYSAYGARRVYKALRRESYKVAKCTVERLMREYGIRGVVRGKPHFTTHPDEGAQRAADLVERRFVASGPNELWVSDITYAKTAQGFIYVCFIEDVFSRRIVGLAAV